MADGEVDALRAEYPNRTFVTAGWDTLFWIGGTSVEDTTLLAPTRIHDWNGRIAVLDPFNQKVSVFSDDGQLEWWYSRRGAGPGELENAFTMTTGPTGELWVIDGRNMKIAAFDEHGRERDISIQHFPVEPGSMGTIGETMIFSTQSPGHGVIYTDTSADLNLRSYGPLPWPEPLDPEYNLAMSFAADGRGRFVLAFSYGPGFIIGGVNQQARAYRYIDPIYFALKSGPHVRAAGADSARYGATAASVVGEEIFFLFGGRPFRKAHDEEPTVLVDVYGMDGQYRRSYRLPFDTHDMLVRRDSSFIVLTETAVGFPAILGLRPRVAREH